jgi:hypothetical protein
MTQSLDIVHCFLRVSNGDLINYVVYDYKTLATDIFFARTINKNIINTTLTHSFKKIIIS